MIVVVKFDETANFGLWQKMMKDLLIGTTSFDDYFVQENKEIIEYDK